MLVVGVLVGLVVLVVGRRHRLLLLVGKGTVTATDVKVGDCLKEIPDEHAGIDGQHHRVRASRTPARSSRC